MIIALAYSYALYHLIPKLMVDLSLSLDGTNLLGFVALYIVIHFLVLQFETPWKKRSCFERILNF